MILLNKILTFDKRIDLDEIIEFVQFLKIEGLTQLVLKEHQKRRKLKVL